MLDKVKAEFGSPDTKSILTDDGGAFKGAVNALIKKRDIGKIRTLGGNPQQNGMVERSNEKLKILISKNSHSVRLFFWFFFSKNRAIK